MRIRSELGRTRICVVAFVVAVTLSFLVGWAMAGEGGFRLNRGILNALNRLLWPNGYDGQGNWQGIGSGLSVSLNWTGDMEETAWLNLRTPAGVIALPYVDPTVRYSGTGNFCYTMTEPLSFTSADDVALIKVFSETLADASVRYAGTGLTIQHPNGPVLEVWATADALEIKAGEESWSFECESGSWAMKNTQ